MSSQLRIANQQLFGWQLGNDEAGYPCRFLDQMIMRFSCTKSKANHRLKLGASTR